jgi:hypothetical protein
MSPRRNWDSPNHSLASECAPPHGTKGEGAHSPAGEGVGGVPIPTTGEKLSFLPALCSEPLSQMSGKGSGAPTHQ